MARSLNKVTLIGNVGNDPEIRATAGGTRVAKVSLATNRSWNDGSGQRQEKTEWHRIVMFGKVAEIAGEYLKKGSQAYFEGRLQTRKWTDKEGQDRYTTEIVADRMQMLGSRSGGTARSMPEEPESASAKPAPSPAGGGIDDLEDDIPF